VCHGVGWAGGIDLEVGGEGEGVLPFLAMFKFLVNCWDQIDERFV